MSQLAYALKASGVKKGDRVLVCGPNCPFVADSLQAIAALQAIVVPIKCVPLSLSHFELLKNLNLPFCYLSVRITEPEAAYLIENSGSSLILVDAQFAALVTSAKVPVVVCNDSGLTSDPYEQFLARGAEFDRAHGGLGWEGLEFQPDELATFAISCE